MANDNKKSEKKEEKKSGEDKKLSPMEQLLGEYGSHIGLQNLSHMELRSPEERKQWKQQVLQLALNSPFGQGLATEEQQKEFLGNQDRVDNFLMTYTAEFGARALDTYKLHKEDILKAVPEKGLAQLVYELPAPKLEGEAEGKYGVIVKWHEEQSKLIKLLQSGQGKEEDEGWRKDVSGAGKGIIKKLAEEQIKSDKFYSRNPKHAKQLQALGEEESRAGYEHARGIVELRIAQLAGRINDVLKDDSMKASYAKYALRQAKDEEAMTYVVKAYAASQEEKKDKKKK